LDRPVYWPCEHNFSKVRLSAVKYFKAIRRGYNKKTSADPGYTNASIKNPFSPRWKVIWSNNTYTLDYLADFVDLSNETIFNKYDKDRVYAGRNEELFFIARRWSCLNIKKYDGYNLFLRSLLDYLLFQNFTTIIENWSSRGPLGEYEISKIASSVSRYVWKRRDDPAYKYLFKNYGAMNLREMPCGISIDEKKLVIKQRQALGAKYVHEIRKEKTLKLLLDTISRLSSNRESLSFYNISIKSGISYKTVLKYKTSLLPLVASQ